MPSVSEMANNVFVMDNGGSTIKAGYSTDSKPKLIPNFVAKAKNERRRAFVGSQIEECKDFSGLFYALPFTRGFLDNWEVEKQVWDHIFGSDMYNVNFNDTCLIATEPHFNFVALKEAMIEVIFESLEFNSLYLTNSTTLTAYKSQKQNPSDLCSLVVESGYSFTHFAPYIKSKKIFNNVCRLSLGGKALTNHLKEVISYRQLNVMDETYVVNQIKEDVCYVSTDVDKDLETASLRGKENTIVRDYVLPDYTVIKRGYVRPLEETNGKPKENEQLIRMNNERFMIPEMLFHPSDVHLRNMGIPEAIIHCISLCPEEVQPHLYKNIILTGGNACLPGFRDRVYEDVRKEAHHLFDVRVTLPENPATDAWEGGAMICNDPEFSKLVVTRKQYEENGLGFCLEKFSS
ncbi:hypothetical protein JTE90_022213 [Oedothorax gibbosus]|uniref:Actin-related protein 6 n=1 Tax=Oedothorax gibbosus TaxID=931172 RepID=A0AAV6UAE7_9ARAC|nr:hypothetical protein JTE90_022213 [Oedothorax gibbosus]